MYVTLAIGARAIEKIDKGAHIYSGEYWPRRNGDSLLHPSDAR